MRSSCFQKKTRKSAQAVNSVVAAADTVLKGAESRSEESSSAPTGSLEPAETHLSGQIVMDRQFGSTTLVLASSPVQSLSMSSSADGHAR